jgi:biotin-(acetyl-CoA carboxylase) ligase
MSKFIFVIWQFLLQAEFVHEIDNPCAALDGLVGHALTLRLPGGELAGTAAGIDSSGCLVLTLADGSTQAFAAGEVERVLD